jgi:CheY-like chemotaxis protein
MAAHRPPVVPANGDDALFPNSPDKMAVAPPVAASKRLAEIRVLVVEDDEDSRELICGILQRAGATVLCTESVATAMEGVYHSFDPDIILTDYSMPVADGLDLIREFRAAPSNRSVAVPILVLSAHSEPHWRDRALAAGAADLLVKPFDPANLVSRIAAAVASWRSGPD